MKISDIINLGESQAFLAKSGQLSAIGSKRVDPEDFKKKSAKKTVEKIYSDIKKNK